MLPAPERLLVQEMLGQVHGVARATLYESMQCFHGPDEIDVAIDVLRAVGLLSTIDDHVAPTLALALLDQLGLILV
jgi:hypothetical protein